MKAEVYQTIFDSGIIRPFSSETQKITDEKIFRDASSYFLEETNTFLEIAEKINTTKTYTWLRNIAKVLDQGVRSQTDSVCLYVKLALLRIFAVFSQTRLERLVRVPEVATEADSVHGRREMREDEDDELFRSMARSAENIAMQWRSLLRVVDYNSVKQIDEIMRNNDIPSFWYMQDVEYETVDISVHFKAAMVKAAVQKRQQTIEKKRNRRLAISKIHLMRIKKTIC